MVVGYYQGILVETPLRLVSHKFPANLRDSEFALRSHLGNISASMKVLAEEGNSTVWWVYEKPTSLFLDRLSILPQHALGPGTKILDPSHPLSEKLFSVNFPLHMHRYSVY